MMAKNEKLIRLLQNKADFPFEMKIRSSRLSNMRAVKKSSKIPSFMESNNYEQGKPWLQPLTAYLPKRHTQSVGKVRQLSVQQV